MTNKIYCILGEYKNNKVKIIILSKKSYDININIEKNQINELILENIKKSNNMIYYL